MAFVYIYIILVIFATPFVLAACILSGRISKQEQLRNIATTQHTETEARSWGISPTQRPIY